MQLSRPWQKVWAVSVMLSARSTLSSIRVPAAFATAFTPLLPQETTARQQRSSSSTSRWRSGVTYQHSRSPTTHTFHAIPPRPSSGSNSRLFHATPKRSGGFLSKVKNVAKKVAPKSWFQSDEEKRKADERKRMKQSLKSDLKQVLKDAPLPLRMMGSVIAPLLGGLMSDMAETVNTQKELVDGHLQTAVANIAADPMVAEALGQPLQVGAPFQQAMNSVNINGQTQMRLEMAFPVTGSRGQGVGRMVATKESIDLLEVNVNGRSITVGTANGASRVKEKFSGSNFDTTDDNIIEAEIIEKKRN